MNVLNMGTFQLGLLTLSMTLVSSCHSSDLGSEKAPQVSVDLALAGWDSGAGDVIATKCANCHTAKRSSFVPSNTPKILDGIESPEFFKNPENKSLAKAMRKRIESTDFKRQMPPQFATPLSDNEKAVVIQFLKAVEEGQAPGTPALQPRLDDCKKTSFSAVARHGDDDDDDDDNGSEDDDQDDDDDDDDDDDHRPRPTTVPTVTPVPNPTQSPSPVGGQTPPPVVPSDPCSNPSPGNPLPPTPATPSAVTFAQLQPIVAATCAKGGCHTGAGNDEFRLMTKQDFVDKRDLALSELKAGSMPRGNRTWKDTEDGKRLMMWLSGDMP